MIKIASYLFTKFFRSFITEKLRLAGIISFNIYNSNYTIYTFGCSVQVFYLSVAEPLEFEFFKINGRGVFFSTLLGVLYPANQYLLLQNLPVIFSVRVIRGWNAKYNLSLLKYLWKYRVFKNLSPILSLMLIRSLVYTISFVIGGVFITVLENWFKFVGGRRTRRFWKSVGRLLKSISNEYNNKLIGDRVDFFLEVTGILERRVPRSKRFVLVNTNSLDKSVYSIFNKKSSSICFTHFDTNVGTVGITLKIIRLVR